PKAGADRTRGLTFAGSGNPLGRSAAGKIVRNTTAARVIHWITAAGTVRRKAGNGGHEQPVPIIQQLARSSVGPPDFGYGRFGPAEPRPPGPSGNFHARSRAIGQPSWRHRFAVAHQLVSQTCRLPSETWWKPTLCAFQRTRPPLASPVRPDSPGHLAV